MDFSRGGNSSITSSGATKVTDVQKYGFGTLAVVIISICPILSVAIIGFKKCRAYKYVICTMLGLCIGSLTGDALIHLIPQFLGIYSHGVESSHEHDHRHEEDQNGLWKMVCVCVSLWGFLNVQMIIQGVGQRIENMRLKNSGNIGTSGSDESSISQGGEGDALEVHAHSSVAWMVTIGDAIHNLTDGLAIGAAFSQSNVSGFATSIAIFCHELPHEFGDAALMLSAGWSYKLVLLLQFAAQLTAFVGLYIGIALSNAFEEAQKWIFAVAAGMFLYVALCNAVPEILELTSRYKSIVMGILANCGIAIALSIMVLLALFEEDISKLLNHKNE